MLVSWDNYFKGFLQDVANCASLSPNVSSDRTQMCSHFCIFRNLFTSQYTGSFQMKWNTYHLYFLQPFSCDFFLILVSTIKPYHTPYFIFMNNNNLPLLHAPNENKLFWSFANIMNKASYGGVYGNMVQHNYLIWVTRLDTLAYKVDSTLKQMLYFHASKHVSFTDTFY